MNQTNIPKTGIATDAAHSRKNNETLYRGIDLSNGEQIFYKNLSKNKTVNIGEFLGVIEAVKYILENKHEPAIIYTDSITALTWFRNKKTASTKKDKELGKAEIFLKFMDSEIQHIKVIHWNKDKWGEIPADFGNK